MASDMRPLQQTHGRTANARARVNPGQLQTDNLTHIPRYSYIETPMEMQASKFHQSSSPTNSTIDESPISPREGYMNARNGTITDTATAIERNSEPTASPYGFPAPQQVHPAYFAPYLEDPGTHRQNQTQSAGVPQPPGLTVAENYEEVKSPTNRLTAQASHDRKTGGQSQAQSPPRRQVTQIYAPDSLGRPNGALDHSAGDHKPGQVAHPNSAVDPRWRHGLCSPDATCCLSLACPCIVYGKTQHRLSRKDLKQDPTDLLGYETCNGSCGFFGIACGFQWALATIQRARIRKLYRLDGSFGSDCLRSLFCCCCVIAQDEREVREREALIRQNAGPATGAYIAPGQMSYAPPPR